MPGITLKDKSCVADDVFGLIDIVFSMSQAVCEGSKRGTW